MEHLLVIVGIVVGTAILSWVVNYVRNQLDLKNLPFGKRAAEVAGRVTGSARSGTQFSILYSNT